MENNIDSCGQMIDNNEHQYTTPMSPPLFDKFEVGLIQKHPFVLVVTYITSQRSVCYFWGILVWHQPGDSAQAKVTIQTSGRHKFNIIHYQNIYYPIQMQLRIFVIYKNITATYCSTSKI